MQLTSSLVAFELVTWIMSVTTRLTCTSCFWCPLCVHMLPVISKHESLSDFLFSPTLYYLQLLYKKIHQLSVYV